ncbi:MAG: MarC family protein [Spirochaetales bacterium]|nr:MarC family protein [Spirochaetales bacterium]
MVILARFLAAFIPIFVAVDAVGVLPIFINFTEGLSPEKRRLIVGRAMIVAAVISIVFLFLGKAIFDFLRIEMADFMIAGGVLLFCIAITDILSQKKRRRIPAEDVGAVPLGTPLIVGPAVLSTSLVIVNEYGPVISLVSVLVNILIAGLVFLAADVIIKIIRPSGARVLSKVTSIILASIAVMMVRKGIMLVFF